MRTFVKAHLKWAGLMSVLATMNSTSFYSNCFADALYDIVSIDLAFARMFLFDVITCIVRPSLTAFPRCIWQFWYLFEAVTVRHVLFDNLYVFFHSELVPIAVSWLIASVTLHFFSWLTLFYMGIGVISLNMAMSSCFLQDRADDALNGPHGKANFSLFCNASFGRSWDLTRVYCGVVIGKCQRHRAMRQCSLLNSFLCLDGMVFNNVRVNPHVGTSYCVESAAETSLGTITGSEAVEISRLYERLNRLVMRLGRYQTRSSPPEAPAMRAGRNTVQWFLVRSGTYNKSQEVELKLYLQYYKVVRVPVLRSNGLVIHWL